MFGVLSIPLMWGRRELRRMCHSWEYTSVSYYLEDPLIVGRFSRILNTSSPLEEGIRGFLWWPWQEGSCWSWPQPCWLGGGPVVQSCWIVYTLAKLLYAADIGLIQRGTRSRAKWLIMNLWRRSFTWDIDLNSFSQVSSNACGAVGSKSWVYCRPPQDVEAQQVHIQEWYLSRPSSRYGCARASVTVNLLSGSKASICVSKWTASWVAWLDKV